MFIKKLFYFDVFLQVRRNFLNMNYYRNVRRRKKNIEEIVEFENSVSEK